MSLCTSIVLAAHLFSYHFQPGFNNHNHGIGFECRQDDELSYVAGQYYNSYKKTTRYVGVDYQPLHYGKLDIGSSLAYATGYSGTGNPPITGGVTVRYHLGHVELESLLIPSKTGVIHFMIGWGF